FYRIVYPANTFARWFHRRSADVAALQDSYVPVTDWSAKQRNPACFTMHRGCPPARARHGSPEGDRMRGCRHRAVATLEIAKRSASPETHGIRQVLQIGGTSPMANIKSQKKRIITNEKSRMRNRAVKSELKTATRRDAYRRRRQRRRATPPRAPRAA
ncbi:MAG: 30S ribosomal protein S20, partial [Eggerthellaceae bacterium]